MKTVSAGDRSPGMHLANVLTMRARRGRAWNLERLRALRAAFAVSGDPDLLDIREHYGIRFVTPRAFLDLLVGSE